ncbi:peptidylprolyl isomerase, partial [Bifidobacterium bifidum]
MSVAYHDGMKQSRKCGSGSPSKATDGSGRDAAKMGTKTNTRTRAIIVVATILLIAAIVGTVFLVRSLTASPDSSKTDGASQRDA